MPSQPSLSICQLSIPDTSFGEDLRLIREAGAVGVSIAEHKVVDLDAQLESFNGSGIRASSCIPQNISPLPINPPYMYPGPTAFDERVELMCASIERLAPFDPDSIIMITGSSHGYDPEEAWELAVGGLRTAARVAEANNTKIALEVCRGDVGADFTFLRTLEDAIQFIDEVGSDSIGLCYDLYHVWDTDNVLEDTEKYGSRILSVQYSDWREPARCAADRVLPGDGIIDFPAYIGALRRGGFDGWWDLEIFSDDGRWGTDLPDSLWKMPYPELLSKGQGGFLAAWGQSQSSMTATRP
jgi:sugar phosphate isomerase/epimerase